MILFKYLKDKDLFQTFYEAKLSERLVHGVSASSRVSEFGMILKLEEACSPEYAGKLRRMFTGTSFAYNCYTGSLT
jgi:cullin 1